MPTLYTIGYEGLSLEQFIQELVDHDVRVIIDVRERPLSRKPGFSKSSLSEALERAGIGYESVRALGCPKEIRQAYRKTGDWDDYRTRFSAYLLGQTEALAALLERARTQAVCLMCFEHDHDACHRSIVAEAVIAMAEGELEVQHL